MNHLTTGTFAVPQPQPPPPFNISQKNGTKEGWKCSEKHQHNATLIVVENITNAMGYMKDGHRNSKGHTRYICLSFIFIYFTNYICYSSNLFIPDTAAVAALVLHTKNTSTTGTAMPAKDGAIRGTRAGGNDKGRNAPSSFIGVF